MNHYGCSVDITGEPFFCSEHEVYLTDDGYELISEPDEDTEDWTNSENLLSTY